MATQSISAASITKSAGRAEFAPSGDRHRLFFALLPDAQVRDEIGRAVQYLRARHSSAGHPVAAERYHLTLQFLGDESELRPEMVAHAVATAKTVRASPIDLQIDAATGFPGSKPPWVLRALYPPASLRELRQCLAAALVGERAQAEAIRDFVPHVTVVRDADAPLASCAIAPIAWRARDFVLIHSQTGSIRRYTELGCWPLDASS